AKRAGARLAVDNTVPTPVHTRPIDLGADLVMHSATKYLNGHSDVLCGVLVTAHEDEHWKRLTDLRAQAGAVPGPFEAWLLRRGMRTPVLRVRQASASAPALAKPLHGPPQLPPGPHPGLPDPPPHAGAAPH